MFSLDIIDAQSFEHLEILQMPQLPNPPVRNFNPRETNPELKKLRPAQLLAVQWMEIRRELGGGIVGDTVGMGKAHTLLFVCLTTVDCSNSNMALYAKRQESGPCEGDWLSSLCMSP
jgi:hypothetical protein